jgi:hypothetical protein
MQKKCGIGENVLKTTLLCMFSDETLAAKSGREKLSHFDSNSMI